MGAFPGATSPKRTMLFGSWSGPQCQKTSTTPKQFESDPGLQLKSSRTSSRKNAGQRSRKGAFEMIDFFQHGKFTHFQNGSFRVYVCLVHQDFQNKNKIEIVKRSRHNGKVFATELFTVDRQLSLPGLTRLPGFPGQEESTSRLRVHTQRHLQPVWFRSTWKSNVS